VGAAPAGAATPSPNVAAPHSTATALLSASEFDEFGLEEVAAGLSTYEAGAHPDFETKLALNHHLDGNGRAVSSARLSGVRVSLPPGLVGDPTVIPACETGQFVATGNCPINSQVGIAKVLLNELPPTAEGTEPLFNLQPPHPHSEIARLGFFAGAYPVYIDISVRTAGDYGVTARVHGAPGQSPLLTATTILWGDPADPSHDELRLTTAEAQECSTACKAPGGKRSSGLPPTAFMSNPSACQEQRVDIEVTSYQLPGRTFGATAPMAAIENCQGLDFQPSLEVEPTSHLAGGPTGLHTVVRIPQQVDPAERAASSMRDAKVTLPEGMTIAAGAADGLAACSDAQVRFHDELPAGCPDASQLGSATFVSPALPEALHGEIYQRAPEAGHLFRLWLTSDEFGLHIKLPGEVHADPRTGQLSAEFKDLPQLPVEEVALDFWGGPRAPLKNPDACGSFASAFALTPWSQDPVAHGEAQMTIDEGCARGGFSPGLQAGATHPVAGAYSPLVVNLTRPDGQENIVGVDLTLPKGQLAKLAGVPLCGDSDAAGGNCPADSAIGSVTVAAGPGPQPLWIPQPGKDPTAVYLSGPYRSAPFSIVTVVPAQAGPFDLGTVAVRAGLYLDPETAQATVKTDPLPQFLEGVPILYRTIHVSIDRPGFSLNPTNCSELRTTATLTSDKDTLAHIADRFQVEGCHSLGFDPRLSIKLRGGTERNDYPGLTATLRTRPGDANIRRTSVALPHSEFLAQEHLVTICTRVQFGAGDCPEGSIYGRAKAWTPLLEKPLEGPVYLRSSSHELPDLVAALRGPLEIDLVGRIDSKGGGIRTTFDEVPDAPVSRFVLQMKGGDKGLLVNSQDICQRVHRAAVKMVAQNGRRHSPHPRLSTSCGKGRP
jgi:hypothetical protein